MATTYTATFSSACAPGAPCIFNTDQAKNPSGACMQGIGFPNFAGPPTDGTAVAGTTAIGGAAVQLLYETNGNPNG